MPRVTLRARSNEGLVALSEALPDAPFEVFGAWPDGEELRLLVETAAVESGPLGTTLDRLPEIRDHEFRHVGDGSVLFEVSTPAPEPHGAMAESGVVPSFPLHLEGGWLAGDLVASREQLSAFREELSAANIDHRIERVSPEPDGSDLLTRRQREVVDAAIEHGYYDVPRQCTLTELAGRFDVNKSVASRVLRRAEGRIVIEYRSGRSGTTSR